MRHREPRTAPARPSVLDCTAVISTERALRLTELRDAAPLLDPPRQASDDGCVADDRQHLRTMFESLDFRDFVG